MTNQPPLTPHQALQRLRTMDPFVQDGFTYMLDGPCMCPAEAMYPIAYEDEDCPEAFYPADETLTPETRWYHHGG